MARFRATFLLAGFLLAATSACSSESGAEMPMTAPSLPPNTEAPIVVPTSGTPPSGVDLGSLCMQWATFENPAESKYVLPYSEGTAYEVGQSYCFANGTHRDQLAYDFLMPIGTEVLAARSGEVVLLYDGSPDDNTGYANYLFIQHDDGSVALYGHLQEGSALVELRESVEAGDLIALGGNSGSSMVPHLHFAVFADWPNYEGTDLAINFRNADEPLDVLGGLLMHKKYRALALDHPPVSRPIVPLGVHPEAQLAGVDLSGAVLWGFDFSAADLANARMAGANLGWVSLEQANLSGAVLTNADLSFADLRTADLTDADLSGADLSLARLIGTRLVGADLSGATLSSADLTGADLTGATLHRATLIGVTFDDSTRWPDGFEPPPRP